MAAAESRKARSRLSRSVLLVGVVDIDNGFPPAVALLLPHDDELSGRLRHLAAFILHRRHVGTPLVGEVAGTGDFDLRGGFIRGKTGCTEVLDPELASFIRRRRGGTASR